MTFNPIDLEDFPAYLESLTRDDWQPLFGLIPEIEKADDFGTVEGGEEIEPGEQTRLDNIDLITCCKLITAILRNNRFCDGVLMEFFESGLVLRLLRRMEELVRLR